MNNAPSACLVTLPIELQQIILIALQDPGDLRIAVSSVPCLLQAYREARKTILHKTCFGQVHTDVLLEALLALESSRFTENTRAPERVEEFLEQHLEDRIVPKLTWNPTDAVKLNDLQDHVEFFTTDFAGRALSVNPLSGVLDPCPAPVTRAERTRIERAFYRFETYCNLFRQRSDWEERGLPECLSPDERRDWYHESYAPWESEQLACVHDYLYLRASIPFNDVAAHDIEMGRRWIYLVPERGFPDNVHKQALLSCGLGHLRKLMTANTYRERAQLVLQELDDDFRFLWVGLSHCNEDCLTDPESQHPSLPSEEAETYINSPFIDDPDQGPVEAWRWTHAQHDPVVFVNAYYQSLLRARGYVMWDRSRLLRWGFFQDEWRPRDELNDFEASTDRSEDMIRSCSLRWDLWNLGGRGWWTEGDESHVVWHS